MDEELNNQGRLTRRALKALESEEAPKSEDTKTIENSEAPETLNDITEITEDRSLDEDAALPPETVNNRPTVTLNLTPNLNIKDTKMRSPAKQEKEASIIRKLKKDLDKANQLNIKLQKDLELEESQKNKYWEIMNKKNDKLNEAEKELENAQKNLEETKDKLKNAKEENEKQEKDLDEMNLKIEQLKKMVDADTEKGDKIEELEDELEKKTKQLESLVPLEENYQDMLETKNDLIVQLQGKVKILKEQLHDAREESNKQLEKIVNLTWEKKDLKRKLKEGGNSKNTHEKEKEEKELITVKVIMDSNKEALKEHFKNTEDIKYEFVENIYTTEDLVDNLEVITNNHNNQQQYMIGLGTNNLKIIPKSNKKPEDIQKDTFENIKSASIQIRKKTESIVHILQIPPQRNGEEVNKQIKETNLGLAKLTHKDAGINFITVDDYNKKDKVDIVKRDGIHLKPLGAEILAREVRKNEKIMKETLDSTLVPVDKTAIVIGTRGTRINSLRNKYNLAIETIDSRGTTKITLRGNKENIKKAKEEIKGYLEEAEKTPRRDQYKRRRDQSRSPNRQQRRRTATNTSRYTDDFRDHSERWHPTENWDEWQHTDNWDDWQPIDNTHNSYRQHENWE